METLNLMDPLGWKVSGRFFSFRWQNGGFPSGCVGDGETPAFRICQAAGVPMQSNEVPVGVGHGGSFRLVSTSALENQLEVGL